MSKKGKAFTPTEAREIIRRDLAFMQELKSRPESDTKKALLDLIGTRKNRSPVKNLVRDFLLAKKEASLSEIASKFKIGRVQIKCYIRE